MLFRSHELEVARSLATREVRVDGGRVVGETALPAPTPSGSTPEVAS